MLNRKLLAYCLAFTATATIATQDAKAAEPMHADRGTASVAAATPRFSGPVMRYDHYISAFGVPSGPGPIRIWYYAIGHNGEPLTVGAATKGVENECKELDRLASEWSTILGCPRIDEIHMKAKSERDADVRWLLYQAKQGPLVEIKYYRVIETRVESIWESMKREHWEREAIVRPAIMERLQDFATAFGRPLTEKNIEPLWH
jgi:hypothetical protein